MTGPTGPAAAGTGAPEVAAHERGEHWWPMALAVLSTGLLRLALPSQLRDDDARWVLGVVLGVLVVVLVLGDPGRIDRPVRWLRILRDVLISIITLTNATAVARLVSAIVDGSKWTNDAKVLLGAGAAVWLINVIAFALWYWDLDRGGPAARALGTGSSPAFIFPEMTNPEFVPAGWEPMFFDYLHLSFGVATAFSPTDVSAVKRWAKWVMMAEESVSLVVALLVIARAINILA
jgi:hypothetical protein